MIRKFNNRFNVVKVKGKDGFEPSCTLPGQAVTIDEMLYNFQCGIPQNTRPVVYGTDIQQEDEAFPPFVSDLTDIDFARERVNEVKERMRKEKSEKERERKAAKESVSTEKVASASDAVSS